MLIKSAELAAVAVKKSQYPPDDRREIAFAGRSNVGKSSLLNLIVGRRGLARVSGSPGKTRTINFYDINGSFRIVDLPGYGFTKASKSFTEGWGAMVESYLKGREGLVCVALLVDIRHRPSPQDIQMAEWLRHYGLGGLVVATKADKVSRGEAGRRMADICDALGLDPKADAPLPVSALKKTGLEGLWAALDRTLEREGRPAPGGAT
ncbi:MAG: ribosome biogenesis GTP-binding protein YihA/YsxC [Clostridiales Family XIII bacterium]|jgi:GTP-binding protein|nr:ribosome biogenesis GTP-binding protein YihA/YsxC [Clostridiales Family XIII bacterium]